MDLTELSLRAIGAFYTFAGYVALRAALTSNLIDEALAAIAAQKPKKAERARSVWLLASALVLLVGGVMLMLLLDLAAWPFLISSLGQAAYLLVIAPRYFDVEDPPDARGRRQSANAFVVYGAATAFVVWAALTGRLVDWREVPWPVLAAAAIAVAAYALYVLWMFAKPLRSGRPGA
jgi:hypothetical protein